MSLLHNPGDGSEDDSQVRERRERMNNQARAHTQRARILGSPAARAASEVGLPEVLDDDQIAALLRQGEERASSNRPIVVELPPSDQPLTLDKKI